MSDSAPVVFVHGLWLHASSWAPWEEFFGAAGHPTHAPGWPGDSASVEETRSKADALAGHGVDDVVRAYASAIDALGTKPIVIGHSFGGLIAQRLLTEGHAAAAVAIDAAPIKGVVNLPPSALRVASVALRNPRNRSRAVALTREQFRYGFGNAVSQEESDRLFDAWTIPSPMKPLFEAAFANFSPKSPCKVDTAMSDRGPLLLIAGGKDHTVPASITKTTRKLYGRSSAVTDYHEFADRGHSLALDAGWRDVADVSLAWLRSKGF